MITFSHRKNRLIKYTHFFQAYTLWRLGLVFILVTSWLLVFNVSVIHAWFFVDDTAVLLCSQYSAWDLLFDRATNNFCNPFFLTPLWPISFKLDVFLFGLNPTGYHISNLLIASVGCLLFFSLVRRYVSFWPALVAMLLLASSMPFAFGIGWITRKHYLLGLVFTLASLHSFYQYVDSNLKYWIAIASGFYLAALLCKEAYAFIPILVFLLVPGNLEKRIKLSIPFLSILISYFLWRYLMYGGLGGYPSTETGLGDIIGRLLAQWKTITQEFYGVFALFLLPPVLLLIIRRPYQAGISLAILVITLSPYALYPDSGFNYANKLLASVAAVSLIYALALETSRQSPWLSSIVLASILGLLIGSFVKAQEAQTYVKRVSKHFMATYSSMVDPSIRSTLIISEHPYFYTALSQFRKKLGDNDFSQITAISQELALPFYQDRHFDRVIKSQFSPSDFSSSITVMDGNEAINYLSHQLAIIRQNSSLSVPAVQMKSTHRSLVFTITDQRDGVWLRCIFRSDLSNCLPVSRIYNLPLPQLLPINRVDIFLLSGSQQSLPASFAVPPSHIP